MTRAIKFRGKRLDNGEWLYGDLIHLDGEAYINDNDASMGFMVDESTVGQYVGINDRNGKEIYEGDILRSDQYPFSNMADGKKDNYFAVVFWDEGCGFFAQIWLSAAANVRGISHGIPLMDFEEVKEMEVCGNIHDNGDLLKGGEK